MLILKHLWFSAKSDTSKEVSTSDCIKIFTKLGISEKQIIGSINELSKAGLLRNITSEDITSQSCIVITRRGGFYIKFLCLKLPYVEACLYDTVIDDDEPWESLLNYTSLIEYETSIPRRMELRKNRILYFIEYLSSIEKSNLELLGECEYLQCFDEIKKSITHEINFAIRQSYKWYS